VLQTARNEGVARSFAEVCVELKNWPNQTGDFRAKREAIVKMWISKMEHLTGLDQSMASETNKQSQTKRLAPVSCSIATHAPTSDHVTPPSSRFS
jgi:hypothetical protein